MLETTRPMASHQNCRRRPGLQHVCQIIDAAGRNRNPSERHAGRRPIAMAGPSRIADLVPVEEGIEHLRIHPGRVAPG